MLRTYKLSRHLLREIEQPCNQADEHEESALESALESYGLQLKAMKRSRACKTKNLSPGELEKILQDMPSQDPDAELDPRIMYLASKGVHYATIVETTGLSKWKVQETISCYKKGLTSIKELREQGARKGGFVSQYERMKHNARENGFTSYSAYQESLARRRGFPSKDELRKHQALNNLHTQEVAKYLRERLQELGKSAVWLAREAGIGSSTIGYLVVGTRRITKKMEQRLRDVLENQ